MSDEEHSASAAGCAPPGTPQTRALQWAAALDHLEALVRALPHEPDVQHDLYLILDMLERLRREDRSC